MYVYICVYIGPVWELKLGDYLDEKPISNPVDPFGYIIMVRAY